MKLFKNSLTTLFLALFIVGFTTNGNAQDKRQAVQTYNKALELVNSEDYEQAVSMFEEAIAQGEELGEEGQDIVERARKQLPTTYYQMALTEYRAFQNSKTLSSLDATISAFEEAGEVSEEYGNTQIAEKVPGVITQLMYNRALLQYQQEDFEAALATLDEVIERNANYAKAYYQKGIVTKNMEGGELNEALGYFDQAIEVGNQNNDNQIVTRSREAAGSELVYRGSQAIESKNFSNAVDYLNRALEYNESSEDAYYRLAEAYNGQQKWAEAVEAAQKSLELSNGGRTDKAKNYFSLGTAYQGLGQRADACDAFSNAAYGSFKNSAEHKMEFELKCENI
ncbi:tetratricopeptide repeat protein [Fodinibius sediminis]|uniref:Tetratricopeptide repeat-containing protein n=1 Tax=Fodinibius sediminis TaxID=1214077 RepID=A0A521B5I4_9BACT|nr:tetratricopeptide repeat protein [Fodinibius sediminis]SMO42301.1 Tetratricopeptide repeat-containing protein [Fodinibius sediminis]